VSSIVSMPASGSKAMSLFLTKECGRTTLQEERGTDDRGSLAILAAIRSAVIGWSALKARLGCPLCAKSEHSPMQ
jgi:hypothetical protein